MKIKSDKMCDLGIKAREEAWVRYKNTDKGSLGKTAHRNQRIRRSSFLAGAYFILEKLREDDK